MNQLFTKLKVDINRTIHGQKKDDAWTKKGRCMDKKRTMHGQKKESLGQKNKCPYNLFTQTSKETTMTQIILSV
jgi:hypothetical protein